MPEHLGKTRRVVQHEIAVGQAHQLGGAFGRQRLAGGQDALHALHHGRLDGQGVLLHAGESVGGAGTLANAAKVKRALDAQPIEHLRVLRGQPRQMVRSKQRAPAHLLAVDRAVAAQVTEIAGAGQVQAAIGMAGHDGRQ